MKIAVAMKTSVKKKILQLMHLSLFQILFFTSEATNVLHESSHCFHAPVFFNCTSDFVFMLLWCFSLALTLRSL